MTMYHNTLNTTNGNTSTIQIQIWIDGDLQSLTPAELENPEVRGRLLERMQTATAIHIGPWELIARDPELAQHVLSFHGRQVLYHVGEQAFQDPLRATLAVPIAPSDSATGDRLLQTALLAGRVMGGEASSHGKAIYEWRKRLGLGTDQARSYAKRIKENGGANDKTQNATAQVLCDRLIEDLRDKMPDGETPLRCWGEQLWQWDGRCWRTIRNPKRRITKLLRDIMPDDEEVSQQKVGSVVMNVEAVTEFDLPVDNPPPVWIRNEDPLEVENAKVLVTKNVTLDLSAPSEGWRQSAWHHNPRLFSTASIPHDFHPDSACPVWEQTLREIFPRESFDDRRIEVLQEFCGFIFLPWARRKFEKFMLFLGEANAGKSVITDTISYVLGKGNFSAVSLKDFGAKFANVKMHGKIANIAPDLPWIEKVDEQLLKQLVSGQYTQVQDKNEKAFDMKPTAALLFSTNPPLPKFNDTSNGLWRRMILMPFNRVFSGIEIDDDLKDNLEAEAMGILRWMLDGTLRVSQQGFTFCGVCSRARNAHKQEADPVLGFLEDRCVVGGSLEIETDKLYRAFVKHREQGGHKRNITDATFGERLKRVTERDLNEGQLRSRIGNQQSGRAGKPFRVVADSFDGIGRRREGGGSRGYLYTGVDLIDRFYVRRNHQSGKWE